MFARVLRPELMDDPGIDRAAHIAALAGLSRVQWVSRTARVLWPYIRRACASLREPPLRVLDLATGGGDLPIALAQIARKERMPVEFTGCDISRRALALARLRGARTGVRTRFFTRDLLTQGAPDGFHVLTCSLFLHHLSQEQAIQLLASARSASADLVLIDDLRRSRMGLLAATIGTRVLSRSRVVHVDAARSVRAAFTCEELATLACAAGMRHHTIRQHWPWRQLLIWGRNERG